MANSTWLRLRLRPGLEVEWGSRLGPGLGLGLGWGSRLGPGPGVEVERDSGSGLGLEVEWGSRLGSA
jgi:hypothetical protein